jgi:hypothetical protein
MKGKSYVVTTTSKLEDLPKDNAPTPSVLCVQAVVLSRQAGVQSSMGVPNPERHGKPVTRYRMDGGVCANRCALKFQAEVSTGLWRSNVHRQRYSNFGRMGQQQAGRCTHLMQQSTMLKKIVQKFNLNWT